MRKIEKREKESIIGAYKLLKKFIGKQTDELKQDRRKNNQKILELCHLGKFLIYNDIKFSSYQVTEKPDFILLKDNERIGIEHQIIVEPNAKRREGFIENIFCKAEEKLEKDKELPNFLVNCEIKKGVDFKQNQKRELIDKVVEVVKEFVLNDRIIENSLIEGISKPQLSHTNKAAVPNFGAWYQKEITKELIIDAIRKKETKINSYKENRVKIQWLLIVIGGLNESSYEMNENIELDLKTNFDKVYILEDFKEDLYEL